ncbi:ABC transporter permease [Streptomyces sp. NPDC050560]|uniref:ABC transporter permease n=1 Tax=Streptomyces sp. NPDC050560 TaxID=3365630 RepID=UPI00378F0050
MSDDSRRPDAGEPGPPPGAHAHARERVGPWRRFRESPFVAPTVLVFILAAAAGLFAGSYTYNMANPTPRHIPTGVVGAADTARGRAFVAGMEQALDAGLSLRPYESRAAALEAIEQQRIFAVLDNTVERGRGHVTLDVSGASGQSVAQLLQQAAPKVGAETGVPVRVRDVKPLQTGDPRGLAIFYITLASVVLGFVGAMQLLAHAKPLVPVERVLFTLAYSALGAFTIAAVVDWGLGALRLPFAESWAILLLTMFTSGMVATMFSTLFGRWAMLPTWGLMVLLGNPSSGGAVSWPLLPSLLGTIGRWLPPGASVNAQHTAVYFGGHQHVFPFLVLAVWALVSTAVFWIWRHRHPGGRERSAAAGAAESGGTPAPSGGT